jgi:hypothetical protein
MLDMAVMPRMTIQQLSRIATVMRGGYPVSGDSLTMERRLRLIAYCDPDLKVY